MLFIIVVLLSAYVISLMLLLYFVLIHTVRNTLCIWVHTYLHTYKTRMLKQQCVHVWIVIIVVLVIVTALFMVPVKALMLCAVVSLGIWDKCACVSCVPMCTYWSIMHTCHCLHSLNFILNLSIKHKRTLVTITPSPLKRMQRVSRIGSCMQRPNMQVWGETDRVVEALVF